MSRREGVGISGKRAGDPLYRCATSHLHGGCTTGSRSDDTTTFGHSLVTRTYAV